MTEEPRPASLEKTPRLQPWVITCLMAIPAAAPATALIPNANLKMDKNAAGSAGMWIITSKSAPRMYAIAMKGTIFSATAAIHLRPPIMITPALIMRRIPMTRGTTLISPRIVWKANNLTFSEKKADSRLRVILLIWPILPIPKDARAAKIANRTARTLPTTLQPLYEPRPS